MMLIHPLLSTRWLCFAVPVFFGSLHWSTHAQVGNLLQQLQKAIPQQQGQAQTQSPLVPQGQNMRNRQSVGVISSDRWCQEQVGALGKMKIDTSLVASEFKVSDLDTLQDDFRKMFRKGPINKTFPGVGFFRSSFETARVRAIFDTFLAFPEPSTLAALIQLSKSNDTQERADATMALVFIHLQSQELSISRDRWLQLFQSLGDVEHYTTLVFSARLKAYGEFRPKNVAGALSDLVYAGGLPSRYRESEGRKEFDTQNYQTISSQTALDIFRNEPNAPSRDQWKMPIQLAMESEKAQQAFAQKLPNTRIGRLYSEANKLNQQSISIGDEIIKRSQGGNQLLGQIEGLRSLRSTAPGDKPVFEDISPEVQAEQLKMIAKFGLLDDEQKRLLTQAQEKRLIAQGTIAKTYSELTELLANSIGDPVRVSSALPALSQVNNGLIQSCIISSKWEQAMRARDVPRPDPKKTEAMVSDLQSRFRD